MNITERAAIVLQQIDAALELADKANTSAMCARYEHGGGRFFTELPRELIADFYDEPNREAYAASRTGWPTALRCLKTAIEGYLEIRADIHSSVRAIARAADTLTTLCDQWEESR